MFRSFAIVPAAGRGVRMGRPKLLLPWQGSTVIEHVLAAWRASRLTAVVVVVHPGDAQLAEVCGRSGAEVVVPEVAPEDMKASVLLGLARVAARHQPQASDAWLLAPADMPLLHPALIDAVLARHDPASPRIIVPRSAAGRGHPVLFPWPMAAWLAALPADQGTNALLRDQAVVEIPWFGQEPTTDLDTPQDYRRLSEQWPGESTGPAGSGGPGSGE